MSVFTVHEPPPRAANTLAEAERFAFVRDGFYWWAFLLTPLWMLRHGLWLILVIYLVGTAGLDIVLHIVGASRFVITCAGILISLLAGFEASTLRRFTLSRRGWRNVGVVSGDDIEDAERRFFDAWLKTASTRSRPPAQGPSTPMPPMPPASSVPGASGVIGLFPEPGAQR